MDTIHKIRKGAGYLPGYGEHPGTPFLIVMIIMGMILGLDRGIFASIIGGTIMLLALGPIWCMGCIGRANDYERNQEKLSSNVGVE